MFDFDLSDEFRKALRKISKKNPKIARAINRKIKEIIYRDKKTIMAYKNLSHDLKNLKRVHITEWLVITFEVNLNKDFVLFVKISPRDEIYKRK